MDPLVVCRPPVGDQSGQLLLLVGTEADGAPIICQWCWWPAMADSGSTGPKPRAWRTAQASSGLSGIAIGTGGLAGNSGPSMGGWDYAKGRVASTRTIVTMTTADPILFHL